MRKRDNDFLEPDLTPLIDVVFILLIFFLVTSVFKKEELALILNLPPSESSESLKVDQEKDIIIEVSEKKIVFSGKEIQLSEMSELLKKQDPKNTVHIRSDKDTRYQQVIEILDELKGHHFLNINLVTKRP